MVTFSFRETHFVVLVMVHRSPSPQPTLWFLSISGLSHLHVFCQGRRWRGRRGWGEGGFLAMWDATSELPLWVFHVGALHLSDTHQETQWAVLHWMVSGGGATVLPRGTVVGEGFLGRSVKLLPSRPEVFSSFFSVAVGAEVSILGFSERVRTCQGHRNRDRKRGNEISYKAMCCGYNKPASRRHSHFKFTSLWSKAELNFGYSSPQRSFYNFLYFGPLHHTILPTRLIS